MGHQPSIDEIAAAAVTKDILSKFALPVSRTAMNTSTEKQSIELIEMVEAVKCALAELYPLQGSIIAKTFLSGATSCPRQDPTAGSQRDLTGGENSSFSVRESANRDS